MDIQAYISSGILELYVAGALPPHEMEEVTKVVNTHPKIKKEVEEIENAFIAFAALNAPELDTDLERKLINISTPPPSSNLKIVSTKESIESTKTIIPKWLGGLVAASSLLLLGSLGLNLYQYQQLANANDTIDELLAEKRVFADDLQNMKAKYDKGSNTLQEVLAADVQKVILKGTDNAPQAQAVVFWNTNTQKVLVDASLLPPPPGGKEYQLWSLSSMDPLTPNDAGLLSDFISNKDDLFRTKEVREAKAFAITLEPLGGSPSPSLDQLFVLGTI